MTSTRNLQELLAAIPGIEMDTIADLPISAIVYDSRRATPDSLFVAIPGFEHDGLRYADDAVRNGAVVVVGENATWTGEASYIQVADARQALAELAAALHGYPHQRLAVCGITGTNGKTTTAWMIRTILRAVGHQPGLVSSVEYHTGTTSHGASRTTPESADLQALLAEMVANGCDHVVMEVSSHGLVLKRVASLEFDVAVFTNLSRDHLDFHGTMENYFEAKASLLEKLAGPQAYAVINLDTVEFAPLFDRHSGATISFSFDNSDADIFVQNPVFKGNATTGQLVTPAGVYDLKLSLPGRFNVMNALAAVGASVALGLDIEQVVAALSSITPVPGRYNAVDCGQPFAVIIDFAHTPDGLLRLIETARETTTERVLVLFGCGGDRDRGKRSEMGRIATEYADHAVVTSDNPRREDPQAIINDIEPGLVPGNYDLVIDRADAVRFILSQAQPGDTVLLAGKGIEDYQEIGAERHPYSDRAVATTVLGELGYHAAEVTT